jgi:hypothetical protein
MTTPEEGLVRVDKARLREVRDHHRELVEMARHQDTLASAWLLLGAQAAAIDALLSELVDE